MEPWVNGESDIEFISSSLLKSSYKWNKSYLRSRLVSDGVVYSATYMMVVYSVIWGGVQWYVVEYIA